MSTLLKLLGSLWVLPWTLVGVCVAAGNARGLSWYPGLPAVVGALEPGSWLRRRLLRNHWGALVCGNVVLVTESWYLQDPEMVSALAIEVRIQMLLGPFSVFPIAKTALGPS